MRTLANIFLSLINPTSIIFIIIALICACILIFLQILQCYYKGYMRYNRLSKHVYCGFACSVLNILYILNNV